MYEALESTISSEELPFDPEEIGVNFSKKNVSLVRSEELTSETYQKLRKNVSTIYLKIITNLFEEKNPAEALDLLGHEAFSEWLAELIVNFILSGPPNMIASRQDAENVDALLTFLQEMKFSVERRGVAAIRVKSDEDQEEIANAIDKFYAEKNLDSTVRMHSVENDSE